MRFILILWLSLLWVHPVHACDLPPDYVPIAERAPNALLFEIRGCDVPTSYLFGTFHSDSPKLHPLEQALTPYIEQSQRLWLEVVTSPVSMIKAQRAMMLPSDSPNLPQMIGEEMFARVEQILLPRLGFQSSIAKRFRPWALALLAQYPPHEDDGIVLDQRLQFIAAEAAVPISAIEQMQDQFAIFHEMPQQMQLDFLQDTLDDADQIDQMITDLESHYLQYDLLGLYQQANEQLALVAQDYPKLAQYLQDRLIVKRNHQMADKISKHHDMTAFFAVGALHLPGKEGIISLLEAKGHQFYPVSLSSES